MPKMATKAADNVFYKARICDDFCRGKTAEDAQRILVRIAAAMLERISATSSDEIEGS